MSFRRLVHLVVDDMNVRRRTYSLRSIDMSHLFRRPLKSIGGRPDHPPPMEENQEMKPSPLPAPAMSFYPPRGSRYHDDGVMTFMLLGGKHNKVVATDQTGRAVLHDPDQHAVHTLRNFTRPKSTPVSLTVGGDHLYVLDTLPEPGNEDQCFECLEYNRDGDGDEDWYPRVLPPPRPYKYEPDPAMGDSTPGVDSYAMSGDGSHILISEEGVGTYSFDTAAAAWSKAGDWTLPFSGLAEYVPEHGFWFGLKYDRCVFCAVDLASASARRPPAVRNLWKDLTPPAEWTVPLTSHLVHLGSARFCIARFFTTDPFTSSSYPVTHAVFTAVEVERCADADGGLRMVKHGSKLYTLLDDMVYWVL
ncbi:uncharacterized protein LOC133905443 [Phragmites australis]|uniref:uncharacterized protein LOC133905443 n=1 Tax=Phragmites australis TaxID=29695 RepID=UPI002D77AB8D|nr:uncharacterized protein LOC133905443 [Phragmites australis]